MILKKEKNITKLFYEKCAENGLKITPQRKIIFEELAKAKDHPSADALFKRARKHLANISFDTVYRTLLSFSEIGVISLVEGYGEQKRFEPNLEKHHHFRCRVCHTIYDFEDESYDDIAVPKAVQKHGTVTSKRVVLEGVCTRCKRK